MEKPRACQQDQAAREKACHPEGTVGQGEQRLQKGSCRRYGVQRTVEAEREKRKPEASTGLPVSQQARPHRQPQCQTRLPAEKKNQVDSSLEENVALLYGDGHPTQRPEKQAGKDNSISGKKEMCPVC